MLVLVFLSMPGLAGQGDELVREPLEIRSASGVHRFDVEVADTPQARSFGLMHRQHLAPDAGMLFDFREDREVAFWMKNTLISLDMLFIDRTGRIAHIAADTVPLSEDLVPSRAVVRFVLEIPGRHQRRPRDSARRHGDQRHHQGCGCRVTAGAEHPRLRSA